MIIDTTQNKFYHEVKRKMELLIADLNRLYPKKKPYAGLTRTISCMYGIVTCVTVNVWERETGLKFDWSQLTGADGEIILQMAEKELNSDCKEFSSQIRFVISNLIPQRGHCVAYRKSSS